MCCRCYGLEDNLVLELYLMNLLLTHISLIVWFLIIVRVSHSLNYCSNIGYDKKCKHLIFINNFYHHLFFKTIFTFSVILMLITNQLNQSLMLKRETKRISLNNYSGSIFKFLVNTFLLIRAMNFNCNGISVDDSYGVFF